jgi:hypothetical protein
MAEETSLSTRGRIAVAAASCSLSLAAGITVAAFLGYISPGPSAGTNAEQVQPTTNAASGAPAPSIVLVPVQPASPDIGRDAPAPDGLRLAAAGETEHEPNRHGRRRAQEDDDDDE